jgi:hypothetical protein
MTPFDYLKILHNKQKNWEDFNDEEQKAFNVFIINKALSMNPAYLDIVNTVQRYTNGGLTQKEVFGLYKSMLPNKFKFFKWIKGEKSSYNHDLLLVVSNYFECSTEHAKGYVDYLEKKGIKQLLTTIGIQEAEIKKMIK